ncbi:MAG: hypothetical protein ACK4OO_08025, partial [bacterium]
MTILSDFNLASPTMYSPFRVVSANSKGIVLEYIPEKVKFDDEEGENVVHLRQGDLYLSPGEPIRPFQMLTVAIPPKSKPSVELISLEWGQHTVNRFKVYHPDINVLSPLQAKLSIPSEELIGPVEVRTLAGVWVARIPVFPVKVAPDGNGGDWVKKLTIRIEFNESSAPTIYHKPAVITSHHRMAIVNADQAALWGRARTSHFSPPSWPQGRIFRFIIEEEGIYRVTFEDLRRLGVDLPAGGIPSSQIRIFSNGGEELPLEPQEPAPLGLIESAIHLEDRGDGIWGPGDWFIFYGKGAGGWRADNEGNWFWDMNHYSTYNIYWLTLDPAGEGKRMERLLPEGDPIRTIQSAQTAIHYEPERFIYGGPGFPGSGRDWYAVS